MLDCETNSDSPASRASEQISKDSADPIKERPKLILLDGGIGEELLRRCATVDENTKDPDTAFTEKSGMKTPNKTHACSLKTHTTWSTQAMVAQPETLAQLHCDYMESGATVLTTNTYALHQDRLVHLPQENKSKEATRIMTELYRIALGACAHALKVYHKNHPSQNKILVAGSIGPLVESYRPDLHPESTEMCTKLYGQAMDCLVSAALWNKVEVDILLLETIASVHHATCIYRAALQQSFQTGQWGRRMEIWLAFTVDDEDGTKLRSGELLVEALHAVENERANHLQVDDNPRREKENRDEISTYLINCTAPEAVASALQVVQRFINAQEKSITKLRKRRIQYGAYANAFSGHTKDFVSQKKNLEKEEQQQEQRGKTDKPKANQPREGGNNHKTLGEISDAPVQREMSPPLYAQFVTSWVEDYGATVVGGCCSTTPEYIATVKNVLANKGFGFR